MLTKDKKAKNKRAQMIMINMLFLFMSIAIVIAFIPALQEMLGIAQQSDGLNCPGYVDWTNTPNKSYNSSYETNTLACMAIDLYMPYIVLAVLIGGVSKLLMSRAPGPEQFM